MTSPLLTTKLYIPPVRPELVPRPRLVERLNAGLHRKLTLVSAPAGFGKTTLVSEWVHGLEVVRRPPQRVAWLSLDESDNDPTRFLAYLIAALRTIEADIGRGPLSALQSPQPPPLEAILTVLINEIAGISDRIVLVLDDYHLIETQSIHDALTFLLRHLPPQLHLVITTREDPPLLLTRLRARGQLTELRATDLRFTSSEAAAFLNQVMDLNLSTEDTAVLETRTEGWIAGLQLAAVSMQGRKDLTGFVNSFTGSHRFVLDYLVEEVLEQQSERVQSFLLQTAVLDRLTGPLCDAVTGQEDGQATLEMLEHANLFIVPLDEERRWYRYHHLFADLLRQRHKRPDWVHRLYNRASEWCRDHGFADEAIEYALLAEDFERAVRLIEGNVDAIWRRGEHTRLHCWLEGLPIELVSSKPHLCVFRAWGLFTSGQQDAAEQALRTAEQALDPSSNGTTETMLQEHDQQRCSVRGRAAAIRAFMSSYLGNVTEIICYARQALEHLPEQDLIWRSSVTVGLGDAHALAGDVAAAYQVRLEASKDCRIAGDIYFIILANIKVGMTLRELGRLREAIEIFQEQMQLANENGMEQTVLIGWMLAMWGEVLAELGDLDGAICQAKKGVELAENGGFFEMLAWSYVCLIRVQFSSGNLTLVEEVLQKMKIIADESAVPFWFVQQMTFWQIRIWLVQEKLEAACQAVSERGLEIDEEFRPLHTMDFFLLNEYILLARIKMSQGQLTESIGLLQQLIGRAETGGRKPRVIEILMLQALAFQARDDTNRAMATLERALSLAEPEGFIYTFVDEGPPMAHLLYEALARGIAPDYARRLLAAFPVPEPEQAAPLGTQVP